jgi:hypothetical protein
MSSRHRLVPALVALSLLVAEATGSIARAAPPRAQGSAVQFDTPTVVDNYRPGFEPDVAVATGPKGQDLTYTSMPFGFSTTQSFVYRSDDDRRSFHLVEGNVLGKPTTCIGGGDTELKVDPVNGNLYFVDLQGLTNFSASTSSDHGASWTTTCTAVNGTGVDRQWLGIDDNGGKSPVGGGAKDGRLYLDYDNANQNTDTANATGNQLVMNESLDGVHYGSFCQAAGIPCLGPPAVISADEGIPGNIVVDNVPGSRFQHRVYAIHTNSAGTGVIVSYCSGASGDNSAAKVAASCTDPTQANADPAHVNVYWHDSFPRKAGAYLTGNLFATIAIDTKGNLYAVWSEYPTVTEPGPLPGLATTSEKGPGVVKVSVSTNGAQTWSKPVVVSPPTLGNNVMPWVTAGDPGRIDIAWYGAPQAKNAQGDYGPDTLDNGTWNVYLAQSLNALSSQPSFAISKVSDHQAKFGNISTQGLGGSPDRSLGDFMQVTTGSRGQAVVSYVDDTSADRNPDLCMPCGQTPPEAAGPIMIATQNQGPSLFVTKGVVQGSQRAVGSVADPSGDAFLSSLGKETKAPAALDLTAASVQQVDAGHLKVTLSTADHTLAHDLSVDPSLGGLVGEWIVRWASPTYAKPGDGNIFYVGMESARGGAPEFYTGTTLGINSTHVKYFAYPKTTDIPGKIEGNTITWTVPMTAIGRPAKGDGLFSITGFTATQLTPSFASVAILPNGGTVGDENIPSTIDATPPFSFFVGGQSSKAISGITGTSAPAAKPVLAGRVPELPVDVPYVIGARAPRPAAGASPIVFVWIAFTAGAAMLSSMGRRRRRSRSGIADR